MNSVCCRWLVVPERTVRGDQTLREAHGPLEPEVAWSRKQAIERLEMARREVEMEEMTCAMRRWARTD